MTPTAFYDDLAEHYHLMFENWDRSIVRQASILGPLLEQYSGTKALQFSIAPAASEHRLWGWRSEVTV